VLLWALAGLVEIIKENRLPPLPEAMLRAIDDGKRETNSVLAWYHDDRIKCDGTTWTPRADVYSDYHRWARERGYSPVNETKFWMRLKLIEPTACEVSARKNNGKTIRYAPVRLLHDNPEIGK